MKFSDPWSPLLSLPKSSRSHARALTLGFALLSGIHLAQADSITYSKIADVSTAAPGSGVNFSDLSAVSIDGSNLVFIGVTNGNTTGIYTSTIFGLSLGRIADTSTTIPNDSGSPMSGPFSGLGTPSISGTNVAFSGTTNSLGGIYTGSIGTVGANLVLQRNDPAAELHEKIGVMSAPLISGTQVAFFSTYINDGTGGVTGSGIYVGTVGLHSTPTILADRLMTPPGHTNFISFNGSVSADGNMVAFRGSYNGGGSGIYAVKTDDSSLTKIADTNTPLPDNSGNFVFTISSPVISGTNVAFSTGSGIYLSDATGMHTVADSSTFVPGLSGVQFSPGGFSSTVSLDGGNVAFTAAYAGGSGLFLEYNGSLLPVVTTSSTLFGDPVYFYSITNEALDGDHVAFSYLVNGPSGTTGVAVANINSVPEPSAWTFLLGGIGSFAMGRRRRKSNAKNR